MKQPVNLQNSNQLIGAIETAMRRQKSRTKSRTLSGCAWNAPVPRFWLLRLLVGFSPGPIWKICAVVKLGNHLPQVWGWTLQKTLKPTPRISPKVVGDVPIFWNGQWNDDFYGTQIIHKYDPKGWTLKKKKTGTLHDTPNFFEFLIGSYGSYYLESVSVSCLSIYLHQKEIHLKEHCCLSWHCPPSLSEGISHHPIHFNWRPSSALLEALYPTTRPSVHALILHSRPGFFDDIMRIFKTGLYRICPKNKTGCYLF